MNYKIEWTFLAEDSYIEEIEFVLLKWNEREVIKFENLVIKELKRISLNPKIGKLKKSAIYSLVISKQTTIFYRIIDESVSIEILLFWNNQKKPNDLAKLL